MNRIALPPAEDLYDKICRALVDKPEASWRAAALERTAVHPLPRQATL
jgi:hypothetical protein